MIVVGLGWRKAALAEHACTLVIRSLRMLEVRRPDYIAVPDFKNGDELPYMVARAWGGEVLWIDYAQLQKVQPACHTTSSMVMGHVGLASVAEACALAGAGGSARLCLPRQVFGGVTCAVAQGD